MILIVAVHEGMALTYDTNDVEKRKISTPNDTEDVTKPEDTFVRRGFTGYTHLHLTIDFKHGKRCTWMPLADALAVAGKDGD